MIYVIADAGLVKGAQGIFFWEFCQCSEIESCKRREPYIDGGLS